MHALPPIGDKRMKRTGSDRQYQYLGDPESSLLISYIRVVKFFHVLVMRKRRIIPRIIICSCRSHCIYLQVPSSLPCAYATLIYLFLFSDQRDSLLVALSTNSYHVLGVTSGTTNDMNGYMSDWQLIILDQHKIEICFYSDTRQVTMTTAPRAPGFAREELTCTSLNVDLRPHAVRSIHLPCTQTMVS